MVQIVFSLYGTTDSSGIQGCRLSRDGARQPTEGDHLNPVRPKDKRKPIPIARKGELDAYPWSSHRAYAGRLKRLVPPWLCLDWLSYFGRTRRAAYVEYRGQIRQMLGQVVTSPWNELRRGRVRAGR